MKDALAPFVDAAWLAAHREEVVLCEVRWTQANAAARDEYRAGHLPGAVFVDLDTDLSDPPTAAAGRHPLPSPERFAARMGELGVGDDDVIVAYDDKGGGVAARLVWMWRVTGRRAALLDGGPEAVDGPRVTGDEVRAPRTVTVRRWPAEHVASLDDARAARVLVDARARDRYRGDNEPIDPRAGHIPGARNTPWMDGLAADKRVLSPAETRARFAAVGVDDDDGVVMYCGSGVTACHAVLACEHAGLRPPRLYVGSWSQWAADESRPAALGDADDAG